MKTYRKVFYLLEAKYILKATLETIKDKNPCNGQSLQGHSISDIKNVGLTTYHT